MNINRVFKKIYFKNHLYHNKLEAEKVVTVFFVHAISTKTYIFILDFSILTFHLSGILEVGHFSSDYLEVSAWTSGWDFLSRMSHH
jgi:hypothetical protein